MIVEGAVLRAGDVVRITAKLVRWRPQCVGELERNLSNAGAAERVRSLSSRRCACT
jgi:hypothetical protein